MCIQSIRLINPFCDASQEKQTKCSLILRTMAVGLGVIALLIGVLILCGIPSLSTLGTTGGSLFSILGALMLLTSVFLRCIEESDQQDSEHSKLISHKRSQDDSQRVNNDSVVDLQGGSETTCSTLDQGNSRNKTDTIDFAKINPANYKQYLDLSGRLNHRTDEEGDFFFIENKGGLAGEVASRSHGMLGSLGCKDLKIKDGKFHHHENGTLETMRTFSNLKDFFDYLFRGDFFHGDGTSSLKFLTLRTVEGIKVRYYNPYKKAD